MVNIRAQRIDALNNSRDTSRESKHDKHVEALESAAKERTVADARIRSCEESLGENEVHEESDEDAGVAEDVGCDADGDIGRARRPDYAHYARHVARHAVPEDHAADAENVVSYQVAAEDAHVGDCADYEEEQKHGADGYVGLDGGYAADACCLGGIGTACHGSRCSPRWS